MPDFGGGGPVIRCALNVADGAEAADGETFEDVAVETAKVTKQANAPQIATTIAIRFMRAPLVSGGEPRPRYPPM
ncbi:hypothetical protein [Actinomadura oligospora]|uniref:hypothetical protein n=1 Tax=Actinomadura oligospora TaxID=111804 RepID=UPI00047EEF6C|nr:hypothetical protein [Actinomadura oligospora]